MKQMKSKVPALTIGVALGLLSGCGGRSDTAGMTPQPISTGMQLDTAGVLAMARQTSEVNSPIPVDGGAVTLTDTSETAEPISVNLM